MEIKVFGQIADITGTSTLHLESATDTNDLISRLHSAYPALASAKYTLAVDKKMVKENTLLSATDVVALLPPFSGG